MHLLSIPRHQIETTPSEYARILASLVGAARRAEACARFEGEFADYVGCRHAIMVSSGRLGMHLILDRLGLASGDEAIVPAFNLFAVIERFCQLGIRPRFCDVRRRDLNLDLAAAERLVTPKTKVLLATHMFGHPADMASAVELARRHDLILLEDCAHALGTRCSDRFAGTFGRAAIFSFSVLKLVTTFGGGMIATNDDELAEGIRRDLTRLRRWRPRPAGLKRALMGTVMDLGTRRLVFSLGAWPMLRLLRALKPDIQQKMMTERPHRVADFDPKCVPLMHPFQATLGRSQLARAGGGSDSGSTRSWLILNRSPCYSPTPAAGTTDSITAYWWTGRRNCPPFCSAAESTRKPANTSTAPTWTSTAPTAPTARWPARSRPGYSVCPTTPA